MGDNRFQAHLARVLDAHDRQATIRSLSDQEVIAALAAASTGAPLRDPYLANILATEAQNRLERGRTIMGSLTEGVLSTDRHGRITFANLAAQDILGRSEKELVGRLAHELLHPYRPDGTPFPRAECPHTSVLETGRSLQVVDHFARSDGSFVEVSCTTAPVRRSEETIGLVYTFRDITEKNRHERERALAVARLTEVIESMGDGFLTLDGDWKIRYLNRHAERTTAALTGIMPGDQLGRELWTLFPMLRGSVFEPLYRRAMRDREPAHLEGQLPPQQRWFEVSLYPWTEGLAVYFRDVTDRKEAQRALQESEARWRALAHSVDEAGWMSDARRNAAVPLSARAGAVEPGPADDWIADLHEEDRPAVEAAWSAAARERRGFEVDVRLARGDAQVRRFRVRGAPVQGAGNAVEGWVGTLRALPRAASEGAGAPDAARRQAAVAELGLVALRAEALDALFAAALDGLRDVLGAPYARILQREPDGRALSHAAGIGWHADVERGASVVAGPGSLAGHALAAAGPVVTADLRAERRFRGDPMLVGHGIASCVCATIRVRGVAWGILGAHAREADAFSDEDARFVERVANVLAHGIQRRETEEELERRVADRTAKLEQAVRDLETFSNTASHDLRAPLRGSAELARLLLEEHGERLDAPAREIVERILRESEKATRLVHDLLAYARSSRREIREEPVDLAEMAAEIIGEMRIRHADRPINVRVEPDLRARADPTLLRIALNNLLSNATKYSSRAKEPLVELFATREGDETVYHVRDNGVGFSAEEAARLFRPFSRLSTAQGFEGTGLGLAMVHRVITRHGGRLWAESRPGRGAVFSFTLPPERAAAGRE